MHARLVILSVVLAVAAACRPDDAPPAVSLDQARRITASIRAQDFVPPPRNVDDIVALLARERPDPARLAALRARADVEVPETLAPAERQQRLQDRAQAASDLGRVAQARRDALAALEIARAHRLDAYAQLAFLRAVEATAGNAADSIRYAETVVAEAGSLAGRRFIALGGSAFNLAEAGHLDQARVYLGRVEALWIESQRWPDPDGYRNVWRAGLAMARGGVAFHGGRSDVAIAEFREGADAFARYRETPGYRAVGATGRGETASLIFRGAAASALAQAGRLPEAELEARRALAEVIGVVGRDHPDTAIVLHAMVRILLDQGRAADAERLAREALAIQERVGMDATALRVMRSRLLLAETLQAQERHGEALEQFETMQRATGGDADLMRRAVASEPALGFSLLRTGRTTEAATALGALAARREADYGDGHVQTAIARGLHAVALHRAGDRARAQAMFATAVPVLLQRDREAGREAGAARTRMTVAVLEGYIDLLTENDDPDAVAEAFRLADAARGRGVQNALGASAARAAIADPQLAEIARREQDAETQIAALYGALNAQLIAPPTQRDQGVMARLRVELDALRAARVALRQEIETRFPGYADLVDARPATIDRARAALADDEALLAMFVGEQRSYVWAVRRTGPVAFARVAAGSAAVAMRVQRLRRALDPAVTRLGDIPVFDVATAHELHTLFVRPVAGAVDGASRLMVVPHGAFAQLPLGVLATAPGGTVADAPGRALFEGYKSVPFLIRRHAIAQVPSVAALVGLRAVPAGRAERRPFVGFGDPQFAPGPGLRVAAAAAAPGTEIAGRGAPLQRRSAPQLSTRSSAGLASLPPLPDTGDEVREIARILGADPLRDVFVGAAASERQVLSMDMSDRRIVVFATHGLVPGDLDGLTQPALALAAPEGGQGDGLLTMDEVLGLRLSADWVVLSACNTAAGDGTGAEAVSGLGRAFFHAGARALLVSNWPVETTSARLLTTDLFRRQVAAPGRPRAELLREAIVALLDGPGAVERGRTTFSYAHPIFWAPFSLVGDGSGS